MKCRSCNQMGHVEKFYKAKGVVIKEKATMMEENNEEEEEILFMV